MNENIAMSLILLCVLAGWVWIWNATTTRLTARGLNYCLAHLAGALFGSGAAFGAFCLSGALLMPQPDNRAAITIGAFGLLVLSLYFALFYPSLRRNKTQSSSVHQPYVAPPAAIAADEPAPPTGVININISFDDPSSCPPPQRRTGGWLVPLAIGLWIGSWGKDD